MHDPQYRVEIARQQTSYNQPGYTSYYLASDMDFRDVSVPDAYFVGQLGHIRSLVEQAVADGDLPNPLASQLTNFLRQASDHHDRGNHRQEAQAIARAVDALERHGNRVDPGLRASLTAQLEMLGF